MFEYNKRKILKNQSIYYRYPRTCNFLITVGALSVLYSKIIYDVAFRPLTAEEIEIDRKYERL